MKIKIELPGNDISAKIKYFVDKFLTSGWGMVGRTKPSHLKCKLFLWGRILLPQARISRQVEA